MTHCSCAQLLTHDTALSSEHTPVTTRSRCTDTTIFAPSTREIHPSEHAPTVPLPRNTALPTVAPATATARYLLTICCHVNYLTSYYYLVKNTCVMSSVIVSFSSLPFPLSNIHVYMSLPFIRPWWSYPLSLPPPHCGQVQNSTHCPVCMCVNPIVGTSVCPFPVTSCSVHAVNPSTALYIHHSSYDPLQLC